MTITYAELDDPMESKDTRIEELETENDEINHLRFALADTEALCLQHEEVITRLTAELAKSERVAKFWEDELIGSKNAINGLLAELAEAKQWQEPLIKEEE